MAILTLSISMQMMRIHAHIESHIVPIPYTLLIMNTSTIEVTTKDHSYLPPLSAMNKTQSSKSQRHAEEGSHA